jgi:hypothetical protein
MSDKSNIRTKADLYAMLAEAVRNTQPQPQPEPVRDAQPTPKRKAKIKRVQPAKNKRNHWNGRRWP